MKLRIGDKELQLLEESNWYIFNLGFLNHISKQFYILILKYSMVFPYTSLYLLVSLMCIGAKGMKLVIPAFCRNKKKKRLNPLFPLCVKSTFNDILFHTVL